MKAVLVWWEAVWKGRGDVNLYIVIIIYYRDVYYPGQAIPFVRTGPTVLL